MLEHHAHELDSIAVVLPSRRAGLYLRKYLAELAGRTIWSPEMLDMGVFMEKISGLRQGHTMEMLFKLHEAHKAVEGERALPIAEFMQWAPIALRDFSEVDAHLLDLESLYRDLRSYEEIENWSLRLGDISAGQQRMINQWRSTGLLHHEMLVRMKAAGIGTSGSIARHASELAKTSNLDFTWKMVWFAGLNALDPASTAVLTDLRKAGKAQFAWDTDLFYLNDHEQEAGIYLRRSIDALGPGVIPPVDLIRTLPRRFRSIAVPSKFAQAKYAAQCLKELSVEERSRTAVILADEDLLMPLLESLSPDIGPINITMGMPLASLPVHGLTEAFIQVHTRATATGHELDALEQLLLHPFLHQGAATSRTIAKLRILQRTRPDMDVILQTASDQGLFAPLELAQAITPMATRTATELPERFNALLNYAKQIRTNDQLVQEQLFRMAKLQRRLALALERAGASDIDLKTYAELRKRLVREEQLAFFGEPLQGMQLMGFLEARAIDHTHIILLGANDGTLPRNTPQQSWIPFEVRRAYKLPLARDSESITAYHFHRLTQHTTDLQLVYDTDEKRAGGPSRYIAQWEHELEGTSGTVFEHESISAPFPARRSIPISIEKDDLVLARIGEILKKGLSPSALGTWLTCPLDFYYKYVLKIRTAEEVDEKLGSDVLGDAVHGVLEDLFKPYKDIELNADDLRETAKGAEQALRTKLSVKFPDSTLDQGYFKLRIAMAGQAMTKYLLAEADRVTDQTTIIQDIELEVEASLRDGTVLKGRCDRTELREGIHHILDLKTGSVQARDLILPDLERDALNADRRYALQLMVYAWCYLMQNPLVPLVRTGIIPLQRASQSEGLFLKITNSDEITRQMLPEIATLLSSLVDELRDPAIPFRHDVNAKYCACCVAG
ncbi:MAG: PD-(D/E)XK nuclease family protein [Flavobacteriales bacterium]|nr:PD-(D/E)XK nuclease family protein [Flavobacteriales bacterium]